MTLFLIKFYLNLIEISSDLVYKDIPLLLFNKFGIKNGKQKYFNIKNIIAKRKGRKRW